MPTVLDVACFIDSNCASAWGRKLHKLLYYSQAWSLVWDREALFSQDLQAWTDGPVSSHVYGKQRYEVLNGNVDSLTVDQKTTVLAVLQAYGGRSGEWLSQLTHKELPWLEARQGLPPEAKSKNPISVESMTRFYSKHSWGEGKQFSPEYLRGLELLVELPDDELAALKAKDSVPGDSYLKWLETGEGDWADNSA